MSVKKIVNDLFHAIELNRCEKVRKILLKNPHMLNHDCRGKENLSLLWKAMLGGHESIVELLISKFKSDPDEKQVYYTGKTFLHHLASCKNYSPDKIKVAKVLIQYGADVNAILPDRDDANPLQIALSCGNLGIVEFLLQNGADLKQADNDDESPVTFTFTYKKDLIPIRKKMLLLLIKYGLDTSFVNKYGENLLHLFLNTFDSFPDILEITEIFVDCGVSVNQADDEGSTPLKYAMDKSDVKLVSFLINKGADVNFKCPDTFYTYPLYWAVWMGNLKLINQILTAGSKIDAREAINGQTALHLACCARDAEIIRLLIRNGADICAGNEYGRSPIYKLNPEKSDYDECMEIMIKEFSKLSFKNISVPQRVLNLIDDDKKTRVYFEKSKNELLRMKNTKFYGTCSYYSILNMSKNVNVLANLTKNEKFNDGFRRKFLFACFEDDLWRIFNEAIQTRDRSLVIASRLKFTFDNLFPEVVLKILAENLTVEDLPLE